MSHIQVSAAIVKDTGLETLTDLQVFCPHELQKCGRKYADSVYTYVRMYV
jgi:hypothetical protein